MAARAEITRSHTTIVKRFHNPADAENEIRWYRRLHGHSITPELLDATDTALTIARYRPATPDYQPAQALVELLMELERLGISHRDVHPGNLLQGPHGPLLIDWETGTGQPGYDLRGPDVTGIPVPEIHLALGTGYRMWWSSPHPASILNQWRSPCLTSTISAGTANPDWRRSSTTSATRQA